MHKTIIICNIYDNNNDNNNDNKEGSIIIYIHYYMRIRIEWKISIIMYYNIYIL